MGYPTSVFNPSARSNGQTIDASHVNDVQNELNALETALLGTITHSLNVSGASTLATVQAGASTFAELFVTKPPPSAVVAAEALTQLANNVSAVLSFSSQVAVYPASMHSTTANSSRLTAPSSGVYLVNAAVSWSAGSTAGVRAIYILRNDTTVIAEDRRMAERTAANALGHTLTVMRPLDANDYVTMRLIQDSGSTGSASVYAFGLTKIR